MFLNNKSVYIHMPKTGGSHIVSLLSSLTNGYESGDKHGSPAEDVLDSDKCYVTSIRNPWDWYLSLWAYGTQGKGAMMKRLTLTKHRLLKKTLRKTLKNPLQYHKLLIKDSLKWFLEDIDSWRSVYDKKQNVESFRKWLKLVHDPANSHLIQDRYGNKAIKDICGYMTYRYLYISCKNAEGLNKPEIISSYSDVVDFESRNCYIDYFIRQESLEDDFCHFIENYHAQTLTDEEKSFIYGKRKTNTSKRGLNISDYYDETSINLVYERDRLIIDKFGYTPTFMTDHIATKNGHSNLQPTFQIKVA